MKNKAIIQILLASAFCLLLIKTNAQKTGSQKWSSEERKSFTSECIGSISDPGISEKLKKEYCACSLEKLEAKFSNAIEVSVLSENELVKEIQPCIDEFVEKLGSSNYEAPRWPEEVETSFMNECRKNAGQNEENYNLIEEACKCSMHKLESYCPNPDELTNLTEEKVNEIILPCIEAMSK